MTVAIGNLLAYRDRIVPRSEAHFLRRLYIAFDRLRPVWVGRRLGNGVSELGAEPLLLGGSGLRGAIHRELFKHLGLLPSTPDLRALQPRIVHAHFGRGGALALPIARKLRIPLVVSFYGGDATKDKHYDRRLFPGIYARRLPALLREAALFVCVSEFVRERLIERGFPPEKLEVIRSGVDIDIAAGAAPDLPPGYIMFAGRFVEKKGATYLIEAMQRLQRENRAPPLVLVGDGPLADELKRQAGGLKNVLFRGWMSNPDLRSWMTGALAVCVPSCAAESGDAEGLPTIIIEAMAAAAPVIGSRHAGIGEAVAHERTGMLVPPRDAEAIAASVRRLCDEPGLRQALGHNARQAAIEQFDARSQSRRLEARLLRVIDEPR